MIRKLRIKIVLLITLLLSVVISGIMAAINIMVQVQSDAQIQQRLERLVEGNGIMLRGFSTDREDGGVFSDYFSVLLTSDNQIISINFSRDVNADTTQIIEYVNQAFSENSDTGTLGRYAYAVCPASYGRIVVFLDISADQQQIDNLRLTTSVTGCAAILVFFLISIALSGWLVRPVRENFDRQKRFISDASHELKTPLAVISANADVLEGEIGDNKWLGYIKDECVRMNELVSELLCLARLDDKGRSRMVFEEFSLSDVVLQTALPFESSMFETGKKFNVDVQPGILLRGDRSAICHIISILIDNAGKYSDNGGEIKVRLYTKGNHKIIEVYNTGIGIKPDKLEKVFERFYREDEARSSETGGYGLGLAIAKSIAELHGGSVSAQSEYGRWAQFNVTL